MEFGHDEADTFSSRLGILSGLTTRNLETSSPGPFHYLTVLKRYGLKPKPKYVLVFITETNDIADIRNYLPWERFGHDYGNYNLTKRNRTRRCIIVFGEGPYLRSGGQGYRNNT